MSEAGPLFGPPDPTDRDYRRPVSFYSRFAEIIMPVVNHPRVAEFKEYDRDPADADPIGNNVIVASILDKPIREVPELDVPLELFPGVSGRIDAITDYPEPSEGFFYKIIWFSTYKADTGEPCTLEGYGNLTPPLSVYDDSRGYDYVLFVFPEGPAKLAEPETLYPHVVFGYPPLDVQDQLKGNWGGHMPEVTLDTNQEAMMQRWFEAGIPKFIQVLDQLPPIPTETS